MDKRNGSPVPTQDDTKYNRAGINQSPPIGFEFTNQETENLPYHGHSLGKLIFTSCLLFMWLNLEEWELSSLCFAGCRFVGGYRLFGTTYRYHIKGSSIPREGREQVATHIFPYIYKNPRVPGFLLWFLDPWRWKRFVIPKRRKPTTHSQVLLPQKNGLWQFKEGS